MQSEDANKIAKSLQEAGYAGLFLSGNRSIFYSIWQNGKNRKQIEWIVQTEEFSMLTRFLASEVLFEKVRDFPQPRWQETLARIYTEALANSGGEDGGSFHLFGNPWGFMFFSEEEGVSGVGAVGQHLIATNRKAIPYLRKILSCSDLLYYEGSQDATLGNSLGYRVNDAAAYYIGKIAGIKIRFYEKISERDEEIERLKEELGNYDCV